MKPLDTNGIRAKREHGEADEDQHNVDAHFVAGIDRYGALLASDRVREAQANRCFS
ncbi:MAG: hypothetical protein IT435_14185 [Phycisphaerales bacterium]|nr:hypothetical protein [Phycisphaerales bacterium]